MQNNPQNPESSTEYHKLIPQYNDPIAPYDNLSQLYTRFSNISSIMYDTLVSLSSANPSPPSNQTPKAFASILASEVKATIQLIDDTFPLSDKPMTGQQLDSKLESLFTQLKHQEKELVNYLNPLDTAIYEIEQELSPLSNAMISSTYFSQDISESPGIKNSSSEASTTK